MKIVRKMCVGILLLGLGVLSLGGEVQGSTKNYFLIDHNYFEDPTVDKGELEEQVGIIRSPKDPEDTSLSNHEFYMKYDFGPEMSNTQNNEYNFNPYNYSHGNGAYVLKQYDSKGNAIRDENNVHLDYLPTPEDKIIQANSVNNTIPASNAPEVVDSFGPSRGDISIKPLLFTYLYVGDGVEGQNNNYQYTTDFLMPDSLGYNEKNKLSDYMLNDANDFIIPSRYNTVRDDVTILMRSKTDINLNTPQAHLEVSDDEGNIITGSADNPKNYFDTKISLHLLPFTYNQLGGTLQRLRYKNTTSRLNGTVEGVDKFNELLNTSLDAIRSYSTAGIAMGVGGGINLAGFYRDGLEDINATMEQRLADAIKTYNAKYYLWQKELTVSGEPRRTWGEAALADEIDGIQYVLTPEVAKYKIEATRPVITTSKDLTLDYDLQQDDFESILGLDSITVEDVGVSNVAVAGKAVNIPVNLDHVRVRIKNIDDTEWSGPIEMSQVKAELSRYVGQTVHILYTYSATDAFAGNIELLPEEIADNTGAYAIPLQRTVTISEEIIGEIVVQYKVKDVGTVLFEQSTSKEVGSLFSHEAPAYFEYNGIQYALTSAESTVEAEYAEGTQQFVFYYEEVKEVAPPEEGVGSGGENGTGESNGSDLENSSGTASGSGTVYLPQTNGSFNQTLALIGMLFVSMSGYLMYRNRWKTNK